MDGTLLFFFVHSRGNSRTWMKALWTVRDEGQCGDKCGNRERKPKRAFLRH